MASLCLACPECIALVDAAIANGGKHVLQSGERLPSCLKRMAALAQADGDPGDEKDGQ